eukprot:4022809-Lingulodinium_polyedra.AAC.1
MDRAGREIRRLIAELNGICALNAELMWGNPNLFRIRGAGGQYDAGHHGDPGRRADKLVWEWHD